MHPLVGNAPKRKDLVLVADIEIDVLASQRQPVSPIPRASDYREAPTQPKRLVAIPLPLSVVASRPMHRRTERAVVDSASSNISVNERGREREGGGTQRERERARERAREQRRETWKRRETRERRFRV